MVPNGRSKIGLQDARDSIGVGDAHSFVRRMGGDCSPKGLDVFQAASNRSDHHPGMADDPPSAQIESEAPSTISVDGRALPHGSVPSLANLRSETPPPSLYRVLRSAG